MKHLIFVKNLNTEEDVKRIDEAFEESRLTYQILLENQCVVIHGSNDLVRAATVLLAQNGYMIK